ncbi:hypothetical protein CRE_24806 [Caenorhabditis remanei]|uniref:Uncharacterized protein n=1 Tax=Caenorhabditis remanei TaxID=31234 RepID=E3NFS9_CAERE|nr:hypothetical protein CRE_24806 [Caenorhabditis remanei]
MRSLTIILLLATISLTSALEAENPQGQVIQGEDYTFVLEDPSVSGLRRIGTEGSQGAEYWYFCERAKGEKKKQCGAWVDEKGTKIKGATLKVTLKGKNAVLLKVLKKDEGVYFTVFEKEPIPSYVDLNVFP